MYSMCLRQEERERIERGRGEEDGKGKRDGDRRRKEGGKGEAEGRERGRERKRRGRGSTLVLDMPCMSVSCSDAIIRYAVLGTQLNGAILIRHAWAHNAIHVLYVLWVVSGMTLGISIPFAYCSCKC